MATVEASNGAVPFWSTKIVADEAGPDHSLTTRTVENSCVFVIVQVSVVPAAGAVTANGPPVYGCEAAPPHWIVAAYPVGTAVSPTKTAVPAT